MNVLAVTTESTLWIAAEGNGLLSFKNNIVTSYTTKNHLLSNHCSDVIAEGNKLYLSTDNGLNVINTGKAITIRSYSQANGLVSNRINRVIRKNKNELLVATDRGIIEFNEANLPPTPASVPYINAIRVNEQPSNQSQLSNLKYNENDISIDFGAINFNRVGNTHYRYKLSGIDSGWNVAFSSTVKYSHLRPGKYVFTMSTQDAGGNWSSKNASFSFYIQTPWWQTWWFIALCVLAGIGVVTLIVRARIRVYQRKLEQQKSMAESELKALRSQINPHFIYNSLNSIQDFIMQNQREDANLYLAKFARLMRNILSHSRTGKISLAEEIESLGLYLELESLRFNNQFTFSFEISDGINPEEIDIPSMILQPYAENAVLHGLASREKDGKITIGFSRDSNFLICTIEDNGIGRKKATELKQQRARRGGKSLGMKITQERIDLLSIGEKHKINLQISDLVDEKENPCGTRVTLNFPIV